MMNLIQLILVATLSGTFGATIMLLLTNDLKEK